MNFVTVFTAFSPAAVQLVRSRLEAADFHPFIAGERCALNIDDYSFATGGTRVQVPEPGAAEAGEFLNPPTK